MTPPLAQIENVVALAAIWAITFTMVCYGTKTIKWSVYLTLPLPYIVLVILFFRRASALARPSPLGAPCMLPATVRGCCPIPSFTITCSVPLE